jgi:hypothetical protein
MQASCCGQSVSALIASKTTCRSPSLDVSVMVLMNGINRSEKLRSSPTPRLVAFLRIAASLVLMMRNVKDI